MPFGAFLRRWMSSTRPAAEPEPARTSVSPELLASTKENEGLRLRAYQDHLGFWTIGYGTLLEKLEINEELAAEWLVGKLREYREAIESDAEVGGIFRGLDAVRQDVVVEMAYQLGVRGIKLFRRFWAALERHDFEWAAEEALDSRVAREQTPERWQRHARRIRSGRWDA